LTSTRVSGEQWDAPNAWPPLQSVAVESLLEVHRQFHGGESSIKNTGRIALSLAKDIGSRFLHNVWAGWRSLGGGDSPLHEKYNGTRSHGVAGGGGEYAPQVGFGWTIGVALQFLSMKQKLWMFDEEEGFRSLWSDKNM